MFPAPNIGPRSRASLCASWDRETSQLGRMRKAGGGLKAMTDSSMTQVRTCCTQPLLYTQYAESSYNVEIFFRCTVFNVIMYDYGHSAQMSLPVAVSLALFFFFFFLRACYCWLIILFSYNAQDLSFQKMVIQVRRTAPASIYHIHPRCFTLVINITQQINHFDVTTELSSGLYQ